MKKFILLFSIIANAAFAQVKIAGIPFPLSWDEKPVTHSVSGNAVTIKAGKETDFYCFADGNYYIHNAPKLIFKPDQNFIFSAKITPDFKSKYDGGAILVFTDTLNWAKVLFEKNSDGSNGLGVSFVNNKKGDDSYHLDVAGNNVYAKVVRAGGIFCFYYSLDGKAWKLLRTFPYQPSDNLRIGFYAQSPTGESCTVQFSEIKYRPEAFKDFFTGE
jgi:regulation of enolase protein 1 (concanavalin A-like superfamily)